MSPAISSFLLPLSFMLTFNCDNNNYERVPFLNQNIEV